MSTNEIGEYDLTERIGHGATGQVWRGRHRVTGQDVAVKVLRGEFADDDDARRRFLREGHLLADRPLPGVVRVLATIDDPSAAAIVMELVEAPTLRHVLTDDEPVQNARAAKLVRALARSLAAAHRDGLIHGDVKPENVLVTGCGTAEESTVLTDFGLARVLEDSGASRSRSQVIGTPHYAAPEIHSGQRSGAPADVYAAGVILYELIVGRRPFEAGNTLGVIQRHLNEEPERTGDFSQALWDLVEKCLSKDPVGRPTAQDMEGTLRRILDEGLIVPEAIPTTGWKRTTPASLGAAGRVPEEDEAPSRRRILLAVVSLASVVTLAIGAAVVSVGTGWLDRAPVAAPGATVTFEEAGRSSPSPSPTAPSSTTVTVTATPILPPVVPGPGQAEPEPEREAPAPAPAPAPRPSNPAPEAPKPAPAPAQKQPSSPTRPPQPLGPQSSWRRLTLPDGRQLEVNLKWDRTATHNDWEVVNFRLSGSKSYAPNFTLTVDGKRVYFQALASVEGGSWYKLNLRGNASRRPFDETFRVEIHTANRPAARLGYVEFRY